MLEERAIPFLKSFGPDLLIVSAGYDALADDPLAQVTDRRGRRAGAFTHVSNDDPFLPALRQLALGPHDFTPIVEKLKEAFGGKIMFGLEGGYDPDMVAAAVQATLAPFLPSSPPSSAAE